VLAAAFSTLALILQVLRVRAFGRRVRFAPPAGRAQDGVRYAFTGALSPRAKESVREHPWAWAVGMMLHAGIFAGTATLVLAVGGHRPEQPWNAFLGALSGLGGTCGGLLLLKRWRSPELRALSLPEDWIANLLVTAFLGMALGWWLNPAWETVFLIEATLLVLLLPFTKLRHAVFFFLARRHLGAFFGRRGVFPVRRMESHG